jgi:carbonic anhydrase
VDTFDDLLEANEAHAATFDTGELAAPPRRRLAVLTCMDCRIDEHEAFGIRPGDAHVLRNAGARASDDAIRSLIKSTHQLEVNRIAVIHHTDCGAAKIELAELRAKVLDRTGHDPVEIDFHLIGDPDATLLADVERIRSSPYLPAGTLVGGFVYDVRTGRLDARAIGETGGDGLRLLNG